MRAIWSLAKPPSPHFLELRTSVDDRVTGRQTVEMTNSDLKSTALTGRRVGIRGKLSGMSRRELQNVIRQHGGQVVDAESPDAELIVVGADEVVIPLPNSGAGAMVDAATIQRSDESTPSSNRGGLEVMNDDGPASSFPDGGRLEPSHAEIVTETQLWERLGLLEDDITVRRLYTPGMLAGVLDVPVAMVRRWIRHRLIIPVREVFRLPYFDFQEVATARRLNDLLRAGISPSTIEKKLAELARLFPKVERPLAQLTVVIEGKQLLFRDDNDLVESGGQRRFDFESLEHSAFLTSDGRPATLKMPVDPITAQKVLPDGSLIQQAAELEDAGHLSEAVEVYRAALAANGPRVDLCFHLADLLYRLGDLSASRERYYVAIEVDERYVEARANLGCVLAELGERDLAIAAFQGALSIYPDYPDVHYHLARTLDDTGQSQEAVLHWQRFFELAPDSPWAEEAALRLGQ